MPKRTVGSVLNRLIELNNAHSSRLRVLEREILIIKRRSDSMEDTSSGSDKAIRKNVGELSARVEKIEGAFSALQNTTKEIIKELKKLATVPKVNELEQMIDLYNPLKSQFITKDEVQRMIEERISSKTI